MFETELRHLPRLAASLLAVAAAGALAFVGCGDDSACTDGVVIDGKCEGKCEPSKCLADNVCVENRCVLGCTSSADCIAGEQACLAAKDDDGQDVNICKYSNVGTSCPYGDECDGSLSCPDGTACGDGVKAPTCADNECRPLHCFGKGTADADAYCSNFDCKTDTDCAVGTYCAPVRLDDKICGTDKGTKDPCIDPADFAVDGATYREGPQSLLRNMCVKRGPCVACATNADCGLEPGQDCVTFGDGNICAKTCLVAKDCEDDHSCTEGYCLPKFGACKGTGQFCEPCVTDDDCAAGGPNVACAQASGDQHACFDFSFPDTCTTKNDCPVAPDGLHHGECLDEGEGYDPSISVYHHCFLPYNAGANKFKCY